MSVKNRTRELIKHVGGVNKLASILKIKPPSVSMWLINNNMPAKRAIQMSRYTNGLFSIDELTDITAIDNKGE